MLMGNYAESGSEFGSELNNTELSDFIMTFGFDVRLTETLNRLLADDRENVWRGRLLRIYKLGQEEKALESDL